MGGKEALRGFLYQGFASVLEALCHEGWDRIYIELDSKNDKVDIALEANHVIVKSIQVKSTINIFKKIESFPPNEIKSEEEAEICLSLTDHFKDRKLKEHLDWNRDIYEKLELFLRTNTDKKRAYQLLWSTHCSIAFAAGRILNSKEGINIFPVQKTATHGTELWDVKLSPGREYPKWKISDSGPVENKYDTALIVNVTRNIHNDVINYVEESHIPVGRLIDCTLEENGATNFSVQDGTHASLLANLIYDAIGGRNLAERRAVLHIFAAAPNALMFFLGQNSMGFGKCILYEYDFEKRSSCTYSPSFDFTN